MANFNYRSRQGQSMAAELTDSACWYCDHRIAEGQRFCDRNCAEAFDDDEFAAERHILARERDRHAAFA